MPALFRYVVKFALLSGMIATAGCSWPGVKIGDDRYLLSPPATKDTTKDAATTGSAREIR